MFTCLESLEALGGEKVRGSHPVCRATFHMSLQPEWPRTFKLRFCSMHNCPIAMEMIPPSSMNENQVNRIPFSKGHGVEECKTYTV